MRPTTAGTSHGSGAGPRTRDEFAESRRAMEQAQAVTSLGDRPLVVLTAGRGAMAGWLPLQEQLATLSSNSSQRVLAEATHDSLLENAGDAALVTQAIRDTLESARTNRQVANLGAKGERQ